MYYNVACGLSLKKLILNFISLFANLNKNEVSALYTLTFFIIYITPENNMLPLYYEKHKYNSKSKKRLIDRLKNRDFIDIKIFVKLWFIIE